MSKPCALFNQYKDGMLEAAQRKFFEDHLEICHECRTRLILLENMTRVLGDSHISVPAINPALIADRIYERKPSWDVLMLSWFKPLPVWCGAAVLLMIVLFLWPISFMEQSDQYSSVLMEEITQVNAYSNLSDVELETWLEHGGAIK